MGVLSETRDRLLELCRDASVDLATPVTVTWTKSGLAIPMKSGPGRAGDGGVRRGREQLIEAALASAPPMTGQAWTDHPSDWTGTLGGVFSMPLRKAGQRAIVVATLNALAGRLGLVAHNLRCRHGRPLDCGRELVRQLRTRFEGAARALVVGYQPGVVEALVESLGTGNVRVLDHDAELVGRTLHGVRIENGGADFTADVRWCDLMLVTGSSVVNGTLDDLLRHSQDASKPLVFFGNTIAAVAAIADLERLCPAGVH
jgi:hypothetical protein